MADRADALAAWRAAGAEPTMLPSGTEVQLELPSVAGLLSRGILPPALRQIALRFASDAGVVKAELDEAEAARMDELERVMIADAVHAIRPPGFEGWTPIRLSPEDLALGARKIAEIDYEALQHLVLRIRSPRQVDAMSRLAQVQGELARAREAGVAGDELTAIERRVVEESEKAARVVEAERVHTLAGWSSFRGLGRGAAAGAGRQDVGRPAVVPADHLGAGGRPRPRRRAPAAADRRAHQHKAGG